MFFFTESFFMKKAYGLCLIYVWDTEHIFQKVLFNSQRFR